MTCESARFWGCWGELQPQQAVIQFPMAVRAQRDEIGEIVNHRDWSIIGEGIDGANVADFNVFIVAAVAADTRKV